MGNNRFSDHGAPSHSPEADIIKHTFAAVTQHKNISCGNVCPACQIDMPFARLLNGCHCRRRTRICDSATGLQVCSLAPARSLSPSASGLPSQLKSIRWVTRSMQVASAPIADKRYLHAWSSWRNGIPMLSWHSERSYTLTFQLCCTIHYTILARAWPNSVHWKHAISEIHQARPPICVGTDQAQNYLRNMIQSTHAT